MADQEQKSYEQQQEDYRAFVRAVQSTYPKIHLVHSKEEFAEFLQEHPELLKSGVSASIFPTPPMPGKSHSGTGSSSEHHAPTTGGHGATGAGGIPLFFLAMLLAPKPEIMEHDKKYQKIEKDLKEEWKKNNPTVDPESKEGLDYLYGSLDDPEAPSLAKDAGKKFRELHPKEAAKYDKKKLIIQRDINNDAAVTHATQQIEEHFQKRYALAEKLGSEGSAEDLRKKIEQKTWREFVEKYPEKAEAYTEKHEGIKRAIEAKQTQEQVSEFNKASKQDIRAVEEKTHYGRESQEATERLEKAAQKGGIQPLSSPTPSLIVPSQTIIPPKPLIDTERKPLTIDSKPTIHQPPTPSLVLPQKKEVSAGKLVTIKGHPLVSAAPSKQSFIQKAIRKTVAVVKKAVPAKPAVPPTPAPTKPAQPPVFVNTILMPTSPAPLPPSPSPRTQQSAEKTPPLPSPPPQPEQNNDTPPSFSPQLSSESLPSAPADIRSPRIAPSSSPPATPSPHAPASGAPPTPPQIPRRRGGGIPGRTNPTQAFSALRKLALSPQQKLVLIFVGLGVVFLIGIVFTLVLTGGGALIALDSGSPSTPFTPGTSSIGAGCPSSETVKQNRQDRNTCRLLNPSIPLYDTAFTEEQINKYVAIYKPTGRSTEDFTVRVRQIVQVSQKAKLNPVLILGYWRTESAFGSGFGCLSAPLGDFEKQLNCAVGGDPNLPLSQTSGALVARCARAQDIHHESCKLLAGIRGSNAANYACGIPVTNAEIYKNYPINIPPQTFDDFAEAYGSTSPLLRCAEGVNNNNCIHTYTQLIEVATEVGACRANLASANNLSYCKFTKHDQNPRDLPYQSQKLLGYFQEVAAQTGVPATVLAGVARVESTTALYTISNYTDEDITAMENAASTIQNNIDQTIPGTSKALCPRSSAGALGIMQIQPPMSIHDILYNQLARADGQEGIPTFETVGAYAEDAVNNGARFFGSSANQLTIADFCNPRKSIYLAAGFILKKMQARGFGDGTKWLPEWNSDKKYFEAVAKGYYGCLRYPTCEDRNTGLGGGPYSYGDDLFTSFTSCPAVAAPGITTATLSCPLQGKRIIGCGSFMSDPKFNRGVCNGTQPENRGHCGTTYGSCWKGSIEATKKQRWANSIDIDGGRGEVGYLPHINGQPVMWTYVPEFQYYVPPQFGGGYGQGFVANVGSDKWTIYMVHVDSQVIPPPAGRTHYLSGDPVVTVAATSYTHIHFNVGKNVIHQSLDDGWLAPEGLGTCVE